MFGIAWSELLLIGIVALVVVPPKDLPTMMRTVGKWVGQMRRMTSDFQHQISSALREAEFDDIRKSVSDLTTMDAMADIREELESATKPLTQMEGQFREDLSIEAPRGKSFALDTTVPAPSASPLPSFEADSTTPPGHVSWPGAMEATAETGHSEPEPALPQPAPEHSTFEPVPAPIPVEVARLPAHLRGPDPEPSAIEPNPATEHETPPAARVSGVSS